MSFLVAAAAALAALLMRAIELTGLGVMAMICLLVALTGCSGKTLDLAPEWRPLEQVRESPIMAAGLGDAGGRAIGETVWVKNLKEWEERLPPGPLRDAVLHHEREHAIRQEKAGLYEWLAKYGASRDFAWEEEQRGWYAQIQHLRSRGQNVDPAAVARAIAKYRGPWGSLVKEEEARAWVDAVLQGRWKP